MGDTDAHAQHGMAEMDRRAGLHRPEPRPRGEASSRRHRRRQDPVYRELAQVRDRIMGLMGETVVAPALRAAGGYAGEGAARARRSSYLCFFSFVSEAWPSPRPGWPTPPPAPCGWSRGAASARTRRWRRWPATTAAAPTSWRSPSAPSSPLTKCRRAIGNTTCCGVQDLAVQDFAALSMPADFVNGLLAGGGAAAARGPPPADRSRRGPVREGPPGRRRPRRRGRASPRPPQPPSAPRQRCRASEGISHR